MGKKNILLVGDGVISSGFSSVMHGIISNLPKRTYNVTHLAVNYHGDPHEYDWQIYPAGVGGDYLGINRIRNNFSAIKWDGIFILNDVWVIDKYLKVIKESFQRIPPIVVYFPVDAKYLDRAWFANFDIVNKTVVYTKFGYDEVMKVFPSENLEIIPHGTNLETFRQLSEDRNPIKQAVFSGKPEYANSFIVLNANRNQERKRYDLTIKGFSLFAKDKPKNVLLYCHCGLKDVGWDIVKLSARYGIDDRLILTNTNPGIQQIPTERLNLIYNSCEVGLNTSVAAHPGDTLASALLAAGVTAVGRSFKYHRPRGVLAAGSEEPNALVTVGEGAAAAPNVKATVQEAFDGLAATSQNRWPSLGFDVGAVNDLLAPFLGAGFYYKTLMWPAGFWERVYEPLIRRAAGLGALSGAPAPDRSEKAFAFADLLVIGAGPAGLMAALVAGRSGARVILADEDFAPGGRLLAERIEVGGQDGADWAAAVWAELASLPNVRLMSRTTVTGVYDGGSFAAYERVGEHRASPPAALPPGCFWRIVAPRAVLASGATERLVAFPGNDRPGVMLAGAVRAYLNRWAVAPRRAAVFAAGDDGARTAADLAAAGVEVAAVIDPLAGAEVVGTRGRGGVSAIAVRRGDRVEWLEVDCLAVSGGWNPNVQLTCHLGARPVWDERVAAFVPAAGAVPGMAVAAAAAGAFSTAAALRQGAEAAAEALGIAAPAVPEAEDGEGVTAAFWAVQAKGRAFVDMQNDVTVKDLGLAVQEGFGRAEHAKRYTTLGMATDQGRTGGVVGSAVIAALTGRGLAETGVTTARPPFVPVPIAAMGAGAEGPGLAPRRLTPAHGAAAAMGAVFVEAGLWLRAGHFPRTDEDVAAATRREAAMVRAAVGVCDVSTLGKIEVFGPDARALLDRVYANTISTLADGRVRYGAMLREDGFVMDDGTVARLGERFLVSTTTAAAGEVLSHLEFCAECLWPELEVAIVPVTEQWAQVAVAGPQAREVVAAVAPGAEGLPFLGCVAVAVAGVPGRAFRISFSGELGFELAVPARYGAALFERLVALAREAGGGPYGLEALEVLRIEKGLLTHAELHGRTTLFDLGLGRMLKAGDCVGRALAQRPGLSGPEREQLVGLRPVDGGRLVGGAHLVEPGAAFTAANDLGYLTSACFSPALGHDIALGFLVDGRARHGARLRAVCALRGINSDVEVVAPVFVDPEGGRARG